MNTKKQLIRIILNSKLNQFHQQELEHMSFEIVKKIFNILPKKANLHIATKQN